MAYLACFLAGFSLANKYEFIFYPLVILYALAFVKPIGKKGGVISLTAFLSVPCLSFLQDDF